ncbi:MAG: reactive intermediate/imine deaminase [Candidatus Firestonebacteria bacterium RIFOXYC2_FULL_39_67]|nr:MAG: reactive intermediate/imine deaminase [Candidatus Firestonebacteria bacterium RIFOXYD2_FULL_39_29]OGF51826.1 MAG: reactive intermediate/imine deaminase [Candidatus Firestonebacteria bacterium RifOxyC12_full_39_7]OGF53897.1 MAG: reactive intermediate/imine deaminase [Candidatus Firestonebacteria bacterium RIFOXYC2_FULL_39_67]
MSKEIISTDKAPKALGPYSQAVKVGNLVFFSGQIPLDPATGIKIAGGIEAQTKRVMDSLKSVAEAAGGSMDKIVKTTIYLKDLNDFKFVNLVYEKYFTVNYPARVTVGISDLPKGVDLEIDAIMSLE